MSLVHHAAFKNHYLIDGFSMIELLVAMVVLAIGLLGMAGLQTAGLSNNQSAYYRSQATIAIADIVDRMRSNKVGVDAGYYQGFNTNSSSIPTYQTCIDAATGCNAQQLSDYDKHQWTKLFKNIDSSNNYIALLPDAVGEINYDVLTKIYSVKISWQEADWAAGGTKVAKTQDMQVNISL